MDTIHNTLGGATSEGEVIEMCTVFEEEESRKYSNTPIVSELVKVVNIYIVEFNGPVLVAELFEGRANINARTGPCSEEQDCDFLLRVDGLLGEFSRPKNNGVNILIPERQ